MPEREFKLPDLGEGLTDGEVVRWPVMKFLRSNAGTCLNQRPVVKVGERVIKGAL